MSACKAFGQILAAAADLPEPGLSPHDVRDVAAALERDRVRAVIDGWNLSDSENIVSTDGNEYAAVVYLSWRGGPRGGRIDRTFRALTLDGARKLAADAIEAGAL